MRWKVQIKMFDPNWKEWHWAECCFVYSTEMLGIVERALQLAGQETRTVEDAAWSS